MTKKKVVTFFAVSALCGAMAIGSSMAYLTDHDSVTNKFSVGKVDIEGQEPNYTPDPDGKTNNILTWLIPYAFFFTYITSYRYTNEILLYYIFRQNSTNFYW